MSDHVLLFLIGIALERRFEVSVVLEVWMIKFVRSKLDKEKKK